MMPSNSDQDWKRFGEIDPYYAVLTDDQYKGGNLSDETLESYFTSGERFVNSTLATLREHFGSEFQPERGLDFGCGTARLTIPLARICQSVVGVDISPHMLEKARSHSEKAGVNNVEFVLGDDALSNLKGKFDLILSYIVLQHIPSKRGEMLFAEMLSRLNVNGMGCIHMPYLREMSSVRRVGYHLRIRVPYVNQILNRAANKPTHQPPMQYNAYPINRMLYLLHRANCNEMFIRLADDRDLHSVYNSAFLYFKKSA